ncbi:hypothetical protein chiPu_0000068 [Chiloscyllium punctatum]|uniref:Uncharacterized protein n=1 Tax=Chiloscyllium punctatum TaxID=137246 RepID=A0A401RN79_CHIPU|nr:hypothetical protein [Chiloscyllium punctatum]
MNDSIKILLRSPLQLFFSVANEKTDRNPRPVERFARSKSQTSLRHSGARFEGKDEKRKEKIGNAVDSQNPEEVLAEEFLSVDNPDALEKAAIRLAITCEKQ